MFYLIIDKFRFLPTLKGEGMGKDEDVEKSIEIIIKVQGEKYVLSLDEAREILKSLKNLLEGGESERD